MSPKYFAPTGGHPPQEQLLTDRAVFTDAYAVIPKGTMRDIVTSFLPFWDNTRLWVLSRPLSGFAETFSQYIMEVGPGGGSDRPENDPMAEGVIFVVEGTGRLTVGGMDHDVAPGGYAYLPPGQDWAFHNDGAAPVRFHWVRKLYEAVDGLPAPEAFVTNETMIQCIKGNRTVHGTRINIDILQPMGQLTSDRTLSGRRMSVYGYGYLSHYCKLMFNPKWLDAAARLYFA